MFSTDFCAFAIDILLRPSKLSSVVTLMAKSPIITTLDTLIADLKDSMQIVKEKEKHIAGLTAAIRSLVGVCEDEDVKAEYLAALDELSDKPGFVSAIRTLLRAHPQGLTPGVIKIGIQQAKLMDLTNYSNPAASIHTTLRRMADSGEVESFINEAGEKAYKFTIAEQKMRAAIGRKTLSRNMADGLANIVAPRRKK